MSRSRRRSSTHSDVEDSFDRLLAGWKRSETRRGAQWVVQSVSAAQARKEYHCPGCGRQIEVSVAHLVAWRADGVLGDEADLAARRHWHTYCWRMA